MNNVENVGEEDTVLKFNETVVIEPQLIACIIVSSNKAHYDYSISVRCPWQQTEIWPSHREHSWKAKPGTKTKPSPKNIS